MSEPTYTVTALYEGERVYCRPIKVGGLILNELQAVPWLSVFGPKLKASFEAAEGDPRLSDVRIVHMPRFGHASGEES